MSSGTLLADTICCPRCFNSLTRTLLSQILVVIGVTLALFKNVEKGINDQSDYVLTLAKRNCRNIEISNSVQKSRTAATKYKEADAVLCMLLLHHIFNIEAVFESIAQGLPIRPVLSRSKPGDQKELKQQLDINIWKQCSSAPLRHILSLITTPHLPILSHCACCSLPVCSARKSVP